MLLSNSYHHGRFRIFEYLVARGYDIFQKWRYLYSWFEQPWFPNHIWYIVGYYKCGLKASYCFEWFKICTFMAILFAPWNWADRQPWHLIYYSSSGFRYPSEHGTSLMGKHFLAKADSAKLNELTKSEITELTSTTLDATALAILNRQGSRGITIVSSQRKSILVSVILSIVIQLIDTVLQTGSKGLPNFWISPRQLESLSHIKICFGSYSIKCNIKPRAIPVIECIT